MGEVDRKSLEDMLLMAAAVSEISIVSSYQRFSETLRQNALEADRARLKREIEQKKEELRREQAKVEQAKREAFLKKG